MEKTEYWEAKQKGLCITCREPREHLSFSRCSVCRTKHARAQRERTQRLCLKGTCTQCARRPRASGERFLCARCSVRTKKRWKDWWRSKRLRIGSLDQRQKGAAECKK